MAKSSGSAAGGQALSSLLFFLIFRFFQSIGAEAFYLWLFGGLAVFALLKTLSTLYGAFQWGRLLAAMKTPTSLYGRTDFPVAGDAEHLGLRISNPDGDGIPVGAAGNILYYDGPGHFSIRAPTNAGKSESSAANICFALGAHRNIIATAKGAELAWLCSRYRRDILKQNVFIINPWRLMAGHGLPCHDFNPAGHLVKLADASNPELIDKARAIALILIPEPPGASGENKFFRLQARDLFTWSIVFVAIQEADTGELCCNLPFLFNRLCGSHEDLQTFLGDMQRCDLYEGTVRRAAGRFLGRLERSPKTAESILAEAQNGLQIFDPAGPLGKSMAYSDFDPRDLKNRDQPTSIFIVIPPEKSQTHSVFAGLCLNTLIDVCVEADRFIPRVTIVADEFANLSDGPLPAILPTLYIGRSRGVQLVTYVQDTQSYAARYGSEASAFTTQAEVTMAWSIRSVKDAREYSERSGMRGVVTESGTVPAGGDGDGRYSLGVSEKGVPYFRPDEFLHLPEFKAVLFYKQHPPLIVDLVSYRMVDPWCRHAQAVPGAPPLKPLPVKYKANP